MATDGGQQLPLIWPVTVVSNYHHRPRMHDRPSQSGGGACPPPEFLTLTLALTLTKNLRKNRKQNTKNVSIKVGIGNGVTKEELRAIVHVIGIYCGVPQALECMRAARKVLDEQK